MVLAPQRQRWIATQNPDFDHLPTTEFFDKANRHHHADPATPAKNMTSKKRMKDIATSIVIDCISFPVSCYGQRVGPQDGMEGVVDSPPWQDWHGNLGF
jgi:hypothetical protein